MASGLTVAGAAALAAATYVADVPLRRGVAARVARAIADVRGRPLLNIGAGTARTAMCGSTLYGDINLDLSGARNVPHGPNVVTFGDAVDLSEFSDGSIGAVLASHVLEHVKDPELALSEWHRVTGDAAAVVVVTPSWWAPHTWLHPGHRWYFTGGQGRGTPHKISGSKVLQVAAAAGAVALAAALGNLAARRNNSLPSLSRDA